MAESQAPGVPGTGTLRVGIDVGGTFTDVVAVDAATRALVARVKVPTTHDAPEGVAAGIVEGLDRLLPSTRRRGSARVSSRTRPRKRRTRCSKATSRGRRRRRCGDRAVARARGRCASPPSRSRPACSRAGCLRSCRRRERRCDARVDALAARASTAIAASDASASIVPDAKRMRSSRRARARPAATTGHDVAHDLRLARADAHGGAQCRDPAAHGPHLAHDGGRGRRARRSPRR